MSDATELTATQLFLLRSALGMNSWSNTKTRNWLQGGLHQTHEADVKELERLGYLEPTQFPGAEGIERYMILTANGIEYVMQHLPTMK